MTDNDSPIPATTESHPETSKNINNQYDIIVSKLTASTDSRHRKINKKLAIAMLLNGESTNNIAKTFSVTPQAVNRQLKPVKDLISELQVHRKHPDIAWEMLEHELLTSISKDDIKKISTDKRIFSAGIARTKLTELKGRRPQNAIQINIDLSKYANKDNVDERGDDNKSMISVTYDDSTADAQQEINNCSQDSNTEGGEGEERRGD